MLFHSPTPRKMLIAKSKLLTVAPNFLIGGISMIGNKIAEYLS